MFHAFQNSNGLKMKSVPGSLWIRLNSATIGTPGTIGTVGTLGTVGTSGLLERSSELRVRHYFKHYPLHERRRISQGKNLPAQLLIGDLSGDARKFFSVGSYFHRRILDHVLTPVLAVDFARGCIIAALVVNKAEFYGPRLTRFSSDRCQIRNQSRSISKIHGFKYRRLPVTRQAPWLFDSVARAGLSLTTFIQLHLD